MTDEELIAWLRERPFRRGSESEGQAKERRQKEREDAADRMEELVKERQALHSNPVGFRYWEGRYRDEKDRVERLEAAIRKAIRLAEQPHYGDRDAALDHCFDAIDVLRAEMKGDKP